MPTTAFARSLTHLDQPPAAVPSLILILADIHFGRGNADAEREKEIELVRCLRSYGDQITELILLGDTFEYYIEYRHLIPKGYSRFQGQLASLADSGTDITYFAGNHDPWHKDYYETEFGARFVPDHEIRTLHDQRCYFFHGDGIGGKRGLYRFLRPILRHPVPVGLYRGLLPGDSGVRLARWVSLTFAAKTHDGVTSHALRRHAEEILESGQAEIVVLGHGHISEQHPFGDGLYLNPGSWHYEKTFVILDDGGPRLLRWDGTVAKESRLPRESASL